MTRRSLATALAVGLLGITSCATAAFNHGVSR
jgi:hypothetical protein